MYIVKAEANQVEKIVDMSVRAFEIDVYVGGVKGDCPPEFDSVEWHKQMAREGHLYQAMIGKDLVGAAIVFPDETEKSVFITDWLGLVPIVICLCFGAVGAIQMVRRRSLFRVDPDIILLGFYYILVILAYLVFEMIPINYRPILINGFLEASYPSSTTLLVLSVMPTLVFQVNRRCERMIVKRIVSIFVVLFSAFMVIGRSVSGVHWVTDIIGSVLLSFGLFKLYQSGVTAIDLRNKNGVQ